MVGDAPWSIFVAVSDQDANLYFLNRRQHGFTAALVNLIEHKYAADPPRNFYGFPPFIGRPFTTPNEAYFAHVDSIVKSAHAHGIVLLIAPLYLGAKCGDYGWCAEVQAASIAELKAWGEYVGKRYRAYDNIIWVIGGDADPTPVQKKVQAMVDGIRSFDSRHLFTAHNAPEQMAVTPWSSAGWVTINNVYTYDVSLYQPVLKAYAGHPVMPVFLIEAAYENEHGVTEQELRAQAYYTVLSGGFGHIFGNCPLWGFGFTYGTCPSTKWKTELNGTGSLNMHHFQALFTSRHWDSLIPDTTHRILLDGYGSFGQSDYATAASAADGSTIIAYLPSPRPVTMSGRSLSGETLHAWWYDPSNGRAIRIGTYPTAGRHTFTPPANRDWVLVLDNSKQVSPPGTN